MINRTLTGLLVAASLMLVGAFQKPAAAQVQQPLVQVVDLVVESVEVVDGELVANVLVTLDVLGETVEQLVAVPLTLGASEGAECDILHLELGPLYLNVLGLVVELDDCNDGPVVVDIDALAGEGLLGDLLCGLAGGLLDGLDLGNLLGLLDDTELAALTSAIQEVLQGVLDGVLAADAGNGNGNGNGNAGGQGNRPAHAGTPGRPPHAAGGQAGTAQAARCDILTLELGPIDLTLLGLQVTTSEICLDVYAEPGSGNLLGNLLCNVVHLLDAPGNRLGQLRGLIRDIRDLIGLLDL